jgi:AraC-like DNA-binding protein
MRYYTIPPPPILKPYIRFYWVLEHELAPGEPAYVYRSIADSCTEMVFHYKATFDELTDGGTENGGPSGIQFQSSRYRRFITRQSFGIFGAYIYPFAVPRFFGMPSSETSNLTLDYDTFLGQPGRELEEQIMLANNNTHRADILSNFFTNRLHNYQPTNHRITTAIHQVIHAHQNQTVAQLANTFNLSVRQFDRQFKTYAGFNPKTYLRLIRLHQAIEQYSLHKTLTQIALDCGYYDQSHFIHDVKAFTGYHPGHYFSGNAEGFISLR